MEKLSGVEKNLSKFSKTGLLLATVLSSCTPRQNIQTNQIDIQKNLETELIDAKDFEQIFDILRKSGFEIGDVLGSSCPEYKMPNKYFQPWQYEYFLKNPHQVQCGIMIANQGLDFVSKTKFSKIFSTQDIIRIKTANGRVEFIPNYFGTRILITKN